jgi:glycosyltransferase involved in cell wall biosynthesis
VALKKLVVHGNALWLPTGYGQQLALLVPRLKSAGYDVVVSAFAGLGGAPLEWNGITVLPQGQDPYGSDVIPAHHYHAQADLVLTLLDVWALQGSLMKDVPLASWIPVDTECLGDGDKNFLNDSGAIPVAMSQHGERLLSESGFNPVYVPHGIDTTIFAPRTDREELREAAGLTGKFVIGILAANKDAIRKGFFPQFEAFARFRKEHCPDAILLVHSLVTNPGGLDLKRMAEECGIVDAVQFSNQYRVLMGLFQPADIASWYNLLNVLSNTALAEGFGLAPLEALACGVPTIVTDGSAMTELSLGPEWRVAGEPFWNPTHAARWITPSIDGIVAAYCSALEKSLSGERGLISAQARDLAVQYDINRVMDSHWRPALAEIEVRLAEKSERKKAALAKE